MNWIQRGYDDRVMSLWQTQPNPTQYTGVLACLLFIYNSHFVQTPTDSILQLSDVTGFQFFVSMTRRYIWHRLTLDNPSMFCKEYVESTSTLNLVSISSLHINIYIGQLYSLCFLVAEQWPGFLFLLLFFAVRPWQGRVWWDSS